MLLSSFWIRSLFFTILQRFSLFFFGVAGFFIITHFGLHKAEVGVYALFQTIITMMEYIKMGLLRNALIKFAHDARYVHRLHEVQSASLIINIIFTLAAVLFIFCFGNGLARLLKTAQLAKLLHWSIALLIVQIAFNHCEIVQQSRMQYKTTFHAYFLRQGLLFLFIAATIFLPGRLLTIDNLVIAQIIALFAAVIFFTAASRKLLHKKLYWNKRMMIRLLQFGRFVFGTALLSHLYKFADHFVTAYATGDPLKGKVYVSYYSVVQRMSGIVDVPFLAAADVLFPKNAEAMASSGTEKVKYYFERMVGVLTALVMPVSLFILVVPGLLIRLVAGYDYLPAVPILQLTMLFAFLRPFYTQFGFTMDAIGKPQINFYMNALSLIITLVSTYVSIMWFGGLMGAVYASIASMIAGCLLFYYILRKNLHIELPNIIRYGVKAYVHGWKWVRKKLLV